MTGGFSDTRGRPEGVSGEETHFPWIRSALRALVAPFQGVLRGLSTTRILILGLAVRLALAPFTSWTQDLYPFYRVVVDMAGGLDPYHSATFTYPPLWAYTLFPLFTTLGLVLSPESFAAFVPSLGPVAEITGMIAPTVTAPIFNLAVKLPLIVADLGVALLLLRWVSGVYGRESGKSALLLWFLNPLVVWIVAVQGQFDVLPAFFTLAAGYLIIRGRFFYGGIALGISVLFKLYPLFLIVPFIFLILGLGRRAVMAERSGRRILYSVLLFILGLSLTLGALGITLMWTRFVEVALLRRTQFVTVGGFTPLFFLSLDIWERLPGTEVFLRPLPGFGPGYFLLLPLAVSFLVGVLILRQPVSRMQRGETTDTVAFLATVSLVALYSSLVLVNPQHLLWVLPFLILVHPRWRNYGRFVIVISLAGLMYIFSLQGPGAFFYPLAVFTPLLSAEWLSAQVETYWALGGLISTRLQQDLIFIASGVGYLTLLTAAFRMVKRWKGSPPGAQSDPAPLVVAHPMDDTRLARISAIAIVALVVSQAVVLSGGIPPSGSFNGFQYDSAGGFVTVDLRGHSIYHASYLITIVGLISQPVPQPIYLYYDDKYPVSNSSRESIFGIADHLITEMRTAGLPSEIKFADTRTLLDLLRGPPAILIVGTTALPQEVFSPDSTRIRSWIESGGTLIWTGSLIGRYMGTSDDTVVDMFQGNGQSSWGPGFVMGFDPIGGKGDAVGGTPTLWTEALDIRYPLTQWGASVESIRAVDGFTLGATTGGSDSRTSLSVLPVGNGTVALFGNAPGAALTYSAEDVIAHDISRLLLSGLLQNPRSSQASLLATREIRLSSSEEARVFLPIQLSGEARVLRVIVTSISPHDPLVAFEDAVV